EMTEQSSRQFGCKQHRDLARRHRTGAQSADSTLGGALTDKYAVFQIFATATDVIPVIALHLAVCLSNHHAAEAVPRIGVAAYETMAVAIHPAALMAVKAGAIGIANARILGKRRRFATQRQFHRLIRLDSPRM